MTWSIVARDASGALGVAIATRFLAAGALCPHSRAGVAALSTQGLVNPLYGPRGLDLLEQGDDPATVVAALIEADDGRDKRQVHIIDATKGRIAIHTGEQCIDWCGHAAGKGFPVAGNMLAGARVIGDTAAFYTAHPELSFAERLIGHRQPPLDLAKASRVYFNRRPQTHGRLCKGDSGPYRIRATRIC